MIATIAGPEKRLLIQRNSPSDGISVYTVDQARELGVGLRLGGQAHHDGHDHAREERPERLIHVLGQGLGVRARGRHIARAVGSIFTHAHMLTEDAVPASNPQNPPAPVARFHSMPSTTVPNSGAMKKLNKAWT